MIPAPIIRQSELSSQPRAIAAEVENSDVIDLSAMSSHCTLYLPEEFPETVQLHAADTAQGPYLPVMDGERTVQPGCACEVVAPHAVLYLKITAEVTEPVRVPVTLKS